MVLQEAPPIIVRVVEQPVQETSIADVIFGSLGLVGVLVIVAAVMGVVLGGGLILFKRYRRRDTLEADDHDVFRVTPTS